MEEISAARDLRRRTKWIMFVGLIVAAIGYVLYELNTESKWVCLGSVYECRADKTAPLGTLGLIIQWAGIVPFTFAFFGWLAARGDLKRMGQL